jgi:outer membrane protein assembly factor BamB
MGPASTSLVWKTPLPPGHSSPVVHGNRIFLTAAEGGRDSDAGRDKVIDEGGKLFTIALDRASGKVLWRKEAPRPRQERFQPTGSPASPTPVTDGRSVYVFFGDFGLIAYTVDGAERWRLPLGPFNNVNGHGSSPILAEGKVILVCDQDTDSYLLAVDQNTGKIAWKTDRSEYTRSYTTPAYFKPAKGPSELIVSGSYELAGYQVQTGEKLWWVRGQSWQPKSVPIIQDGIIYSHSWEGGGEAETPTETPTFDEVVKLYDKNGDRLLTPEELAPMIPNPRAVINSDLGNDGALDERDWNNYRARRASRNRLVAVRHGGRGDLTNSNVIWSMQKFLPNCPTPLLYNGVLYLIKDGGILTAVNPKTGAILKQGRLTGAIGTYYASPVAGGGRVLFLSEAGEAAVVRAGADWELVAVNRFDDPVFATPALVENRIYLRTKSALYCFRAE